METKKPSDTKTLKRDLAPLNIYIRGNYYSFDNIKKPPPSHKKYCIDIHNHRDIEILHVHKGKMYLSVNQNNIVLESGDIAICNPYEAHKAYFFASEPLVEYSYLQIDLYSFLTSHISSVTQMIYSIENQSVLFPNKLSNGTPENNEFKKYFVSAFEAFVGNRDDNNIGNEANLYASIFLLLPALAKLVESYQTQKLGAKEIRFIKDVRKYVSAHYSEAITINDICKALSLSRSNLYRMFEVCFNESPTVYIRNYRILRAATEYRNSGMAISDIALAVGFPNYCYFSKSFKQRIGIPPKKFFMNLKK